MKMIAEMSATQRSEGEIVSLGTRNGMELAILKRTEKSIYCRGMLFCKTPILFRSDSVKRHLPIEYAADLTPVVAAKEARASWNAPGWQKPLDFSSRKEYGGMASGRTPGKIVRRVEGQAPRRSTGIRGKSDEPVG